MRASELLITHFGPKPGEVPELGSEAWAIQEISRACEAPGDVDTRAQQVAKIVAYGVKVGTWRGWIGHAICELAEIIPRGHEWQTILVQAFIISKHGYRQSQRAKEWRKRRQLQQQQVVSDNGHENEECQEQTTTAENSNRELGGLPTIESPGKEDYMDFINIMPIRYILNHSGYVLHSSPTTLTWAQVVAGTKKKVPSPAEEADIAWRSQRWSNWSSFYAKISKHHEFVCFFALRGQCEEGLETPEGDFDSITQAKRHCHLISTSDWFIHCADEIYRYINILQRCKSEWLLKFHHKPGVLCSIEPNKVMGVARWQWWKVQLEAYLYIVSVYTTPSVRKAVSDALLCMENAEKRFRARSDKFYAKPKIFHGRLDKFHGYQEKMHMWREHLHHKQKKQKKQNKTLQTCKGKFYTTEREEKLHLHQENLHGRKKRFHAWKRDSHSWPMGRRMLPQASKDWLYSRT